MNIILDASVFGIAWQTPSARTGVYQVALNYLSTLKKNKDVCLFFDLSENPSAYTGYLEFLKAFPEFSAIPLIGGEKRGMLYRYLEGLKQQSGDTTDWLTKFIGRTIRGLDLLSNLGSFKIPKNSVYHSFFWPLPKRRSSRIKKYVLTVHDLWANNAPIKEFFSRLLSSLTKDDEVICVSEATKKDFFKSLPDFPEKNVHVIPNGVSDFFSLPPKNSKAQYALKEKFHLSGCSVFLSVSTVHERKNPKNLIKAFSDFCEKQDNQNTRLVLVGECTENMHKELKKIPEFEKTKDKILFTGFVSDAELKEWYELSTCFVYPSLYEGFGIPVLEAMACGVPVITSNTSSLPEVAANAAILIDPTNVKEITNALQEIATNSSRRTDLIRKGRERANQFSWKKSSDSLVDLYGKLEVS